MKIRIPAMLILVALIALCLAHATYSQAENRNPDKIESIPLEVEQKIQSLVEKGNLPSLQLAVVSEDRIIWSNAFGQETGTDYLLKIGSIEKVLTSTALLLLYENGQIDISDDVNKYLPFSVRHPDYHDIPITIQMLLAYRSGLDMFQYQFEWDTKDIDSIKSGSRVLPEFVKLSKEDFMKASLDAEGANYNPNIWKFKPGANYHSIFTCGMDIFRFHSWSQQPEIGINGVEK